MYLKVRNVNEAFTAAVEAFACTEQRYRWNIVGRVSRNGPVLACNEPAMITYTHPDERVLFNQSRDANPFFHVFETIWLFAGRNDIRPLTYYVKRFSDYSDDGSTMHASYGHRWRTHFGRDQIIDMLNLLTEQPRTRRGVMLMWDAADLHRVVEMPSCKDVACNLAIKFSLQLPESTPRATVDPDPTLKMTVFNRSNDTVWGMLGANAVHMSMLQELIACAIGARLGPYHQISDDMHIYLDSFCPHGWLTDTTPDYYRTHGRNKMVLVPVLQQGEDVHHFLADCDQFATHWSNPEDQGAWRSRSVRDGRLPEYRNFWLTEVALPLMIAHRYYKDKQYTRAKAWVFKCLADDWRIAAAAWLNRHIAKHTRTTIPSGMEPDTNDWNTL